MQSMILQTSTQYHGKVGHLGCLPKAEQPVPALSDVQLHSVPVCCRPMPEAVQALADPVPQPWLAPRAPPGLHFPSQRPHLALPEARPAGLSPPGCFPHPASVSLSAEAFRLWTPTLARAAPQPLAADPVSASMQPPFSFSWPLTHRPQPYQHPGSICFCMSCSIYQIPLERASS